jgi:hypothetical protein
VKPNTLGRTVEVRMALADDDKVRLPVVSAGAEYLVMGLLMRRNILAYKAPQNHEGYDIVAIHSDPRHELKASEFAQVRIQVKSRFQSDSNRAVLLRKTSLNAFDYLAVVFMNIGKFYGTHDGSTGATEYEVFMLPRSFVARHYVSGKVGKLPLRHLTSKIAPYGGPRGIELVARALGIDQPVRKGRAAARASA